jgi:hypothetical protein
MPTEERTCPRQTEHGLHRWAPDGVTDFRLTVLCHGYIPRAYDDPTWPVHKRPRWVMKETSARLFPCCRWCGHIGQDHPAVQCPLCGTVQCQRSWTCPVCYHGIVGGYRPGDLDKCGYAHCSKPAIAEVPRVRRVCKDHVGRVKLRLHGGRQVMLHVHVEERLAHRDSGKGWEFWRLVNAS